MYIYLNIFLNIHFSGDYTKKYAGIFVCFFVKTAAFPLTGDGLSFILKD